ncbi:MAG: response regulator transcription factor [Actinocatenispora sp.]
MNTRCLIVDDNAQFQRAARRLLERQGICVVGTAFDGREALTRIAQLQPDVVLVDIELDGESGFDLARLLDQRYEDPGPMTDMVRVIMISSHAEEDYRELIESSAAVGMVGKSALSAEAIRALL